MISNYKKLLMCLLIIAGATVVLPQKASAITGPYANANYPMTQVPANQGMNRPRPQRCTDAGGTYQNSAQTSWIAINNGTNFSSQHITVPYGTPSVSLVAVHAASTCYNSLYSPFRTGYRFSSLTANNGASVSGLGGGGIYVVNYPAAANIDTHVGVYALPFTLNLPAGLNGGPYTFTVTMGTEKKINDRQNLIGQPNAFGRYQCVYSGEYVSGFTQAGFNSCTNATNLNMTMTVTVNAAPPTITEFTVTCNGQIRLRATTQTGGRWAARLYVDGHSTLPSAGTPFSLPAAQGNLGRFPSSSPAPGTNASGFTDTSKNIQPWHDVRSHTFQVRVDDQTNSGSLQTFSAVRTVGPCVVPLCSTGSFSTRPSPIVADSPFHLTVNLGFNRARGSRVSSTPFSYRARYDVTRFTTPNQSVDQSATSTSSAVSTEFPSSITAPAGSHSGTIRFTAVSGASFSPLVCRIGNPPGGPPPPPCAIGAPGCPTIPCLSGDPLNCPLTSSNQPYTQAFRGDVIVVGLTGACNGINAHLNPSNNGSGGQLGVFACGGISGFRSANLLPGLPGGGENYLTFANVGSLGGFDVTETAPDYFTSVPDGYISTVSTTAGGGVGSETLVFVNGDLTINNNVTRTGTFIGKIRYIVTGNIYISRGVFELYGDYFARGEIYTCSAGSSSPTSTDLLNIGCHTALPLRIYGSVYARKINLHRLAGNVASAASGEDHSTSSAGEIFIDDPLNWIAGSASTPTSGPRPSEAYTTLPPVL